MLCSFGSRLMKKLLGIVVLGLLWFYTVLASDLSLQIKYISAEEAYSKKLTACVPFLNGGHRFHNAYYTNSNKCLKSEKSYKILNDQGRIEGHPGEFRAGQILTNVESAKYFEWTGSFKNIEKKAIDIILNAAKDLSEEKISKEEFYNIKD